MEDIVLGFIKMLINALLMSCCVVFGIFTLISVVVCFLSILLSFTNIEDISNSFSLKISLLIFSVNCACFAWFFYSLLKIIISRLIW